MSGKEIWIETLGTRVLIKPAAQESRRSSGILLLETAKEKPQSGLASAGGEDEGIPGIVNDKILFPKLTGNVFKFDSEDFLLMESSDILESTKS